jgi:hypothetical protein
MQRMRRHVVRMLVAATALFGLSAVMAGPASAGPCYTVTVENGSPNPPSATVCPFD